MNTVSEDDGGAKRKPALRKVPSKSAIRSRTDRAERPRINANGAAEGNVPAKSADPFSDEQALPKLLEAFGGIYQRSQVRVSRSGRFELPPLKEAGDRVEFARAYAWHHGWRGKRLSRAALRAWKQRLLYDAGLLEVTRSKFRAPPPKQSQLLFDARYPGLLPLHLRVLDGFALQSDLSESEYKKFPFGIAWLATWCGLASWARWPAPAVEMRTLQKLAEENKGEASPEDAVLADIRSNLINAGFIRYEGQGRKRRYFLAPLWQGDKGLDSAQLGRAIERLVRQ